MDKNEINVLDELNKGACMGMDAIHFVLDKVEDEKLKEVLTEQYEKYKSIFSKIMNYILVIKNHMKQM